MQICKAGEGGGVLLPKHPILVLSCPTHKLPARDFAGRGWKTEKVRESGKRGILKDEKRSREQGGRRRQPEYLKDRERQLDSSTSSLGDSFSHVGGKQHTKMWLC